MKDLRLQRHLCTVALHSCSSAHSQCTVLHSAQLLESRGQSENSVAEKLLPAALWFPKHSQPDHTRSVTGRGPDLV